MLRLLEPFIRPCALCEARGPWLWYVAIFAHLSVVLWLRIDRGSFMRCVQVGIGDNGGGREAGRVPEGVLRDGL